MTSNTSIKKRYTKTKTISQEGNSNIRDIMLSFKKRLFIEVIRGKEIGRLYEIYKVRWVIGRVETDLEIDDPKISKKHAVIEAFSKNHISIRDLASTNGTYINGVQINQKKLSDGDIISLGQTQLRFFFHEDKG